MTYSMVLIPPLVLTLLAVWLDLRTREIPNGLSLAILIWGFAACVFGWAGVNYAFFAEGLAMGIAAAALLFFLGKLGGGDAKLLSALGGILGWRGAVLMLVVMALAGGILALVAAVRGRKTFAYGPAIGAGVLAHFLLVMRGGV